MHSWWIRDDSIDPPFVEGLCQAQAPGKDEDGHPILCDEPRYHPGYHRGSFGLGKTRVWTTASGEPVEVEIPFPHILPDHVRKVP